MWFSSLKKMFDKLVLLFLCFKIILFGRKNIKKFILFDKTEKIKQKNKGVPVKELPFTK
jgi:hypothetical protein